MLPHIHYCQKKAGEANTKNFPVSSKVCCGTIIIPILSFLLPLSFTLFLISPLPYAHSFCGSLSSFLLLFLSLLSSVSVLSFQSLSGSVFPAPVWRQALSVPLHSHHMVLYGLWKTAAYTGQSHQNPKMKEQPPSAPWRPMREINWDTREPFEASGAVCSAPLKIRPPMEMSKYGFKYKIVRSQVWHF